MRPNKVLDEITRKKRLLATQVCGVYKITMPDGSVYVGASRHIKERTRKHKYRGVVETIMTFPPDVDRDILDENERKCYYDLLSQGLQMLNVREPGWTGKNTESMRTKMSDSLKGKTPWNKGIKMPKEYCEKLKIAFVNRKRGHHHSEETKQKMRENTSRNAKGRVPWNKGLRKNKIVS